MNTNPPDSQESSEPGQANADLINDLHDLTGKVDSFPLSFTLAWRQYLNHPRQHSPITQQPESTEL
jgi:hypothetical protein